MDAASSPFIGLVCGTRSHRRGYSAPGCVVTTAFLAPVALPVRRGGAVAGVGAVARRYARRPVCASTPTLPAGTRVVVSGGTGFVGRALVRRLAADAVDVVVLARNVPAASRAFSGLPVTVLRYDAALPGPLAPNVADAVRDANAVVNLAGEPVDNGRWTSARKDVLWDSRIVGTAKLARAVARSEFEGVFVSASAVGFYGPNANAQFSENDPPGKDFLAKLASAWEGAALRHTRSADSVRDVILRIGVVLGEGGGALSRLEPAFKAYLGGPPGSGNQWFSWVHIDDLVEVIVRSIADDSFSGIYNATAPKPVRLRELCDALGRTLARPSWLHVPAAAVKFALGSEAADLILAGQYVSSRRLVEDGFTFRFSTIDEALENVFGRVSTANGSQRVRG